MLDLRRAGLVPGDPMPGNHARTQAIPLTDAPDEEQTDAIRRAPPAPESRAAQQNPPRDELSASAWREWSGTNAPPGQSVPGPAAPTEPIQRLNPGQPPPGSTAIDGRTDHLGIADYAGRTNPIPQQVVPPQPGDAGASAPGQYDAVLSHSDLPNLASPQQLPNRAVPQPELRWQLGVPDHPAQHQDSIPAAAAARQSVSASSRTPESSADTGRDRPLSARERRWWLLAGIGAAVVVAIGVGGTLFMVNGSRISAGPTAPGPSMISALSTGQVAPAVPPHPAPTTVAHVAPLIPGYQVVRVPSRGAAFDVPTQWRIDPNGTTTWGTAPNTMEIAGLVQDGKGYCPNYVRTNAFLTMSGQSDPAAAATDIGARLAKIGWSTSTGTTPHTPEPLTSLDGQLHGSFAETDGTFTPPAPGCAKTYAVYTFAFPSENGNFVMTIAADTGVDRSVNKATAKQILASIRPLPDK
jgi:hypothetical protein